MGLNPLFDPGYSQRCNAAPRKNAAPSKTHDQTFPVLFGPAFQ
jgi:hypothetical protein